MHTAWLSRMGECFGNISFIDETAAQRCASDRRMRPYRAYGYVGIASQRQKNSLTTTRAFDDQWPQSQPASADHDRRLCPRDDHHYLPESFIIPARLAIIRVHGHIIYAARGRQLQSAASHAHLRRSFTFTIYKPSLTCSCLHAYT